MSKNGTMMKIVKTNSENPDFIKLTTQLDLDLNNRYGELQKQYDKHNKIDLIDTVIVVYLDYQPVGCVCFKKLDNNTAEIKRMFVSPNNRGKGIASKILKELEIWANEIEISRLILETGIKQIEAINLYNKVGYKRIDNFGQYIGNANSICMEKILSA
jgi:GNAT superfamily N-acetyltransferase